jgi:ankyrin repeat protein
MSSAFRRTLPARPDLDQQKKLAKDLLRGYHAGDRDAVARIRAQLPDKSTISLADAQFVLAREYGFVSWQALSDHVIERRVDTTPPIERFKKAVTERDAQAVRRVVMAHAEVRSQIDAPLFSFDSPALLAALNDIELVDVLLDLGADPNRRSSWWAGGFHALHSARGEVAERLLAAGAVPDACAAANLDRPELLSRLLEADPARVHERGGDGQTPLHFARSRTVVDLLLAAGADIDARDRDHRSTPAEWMLEHTRGAGRYELARYLTDRGAATDIFLAAALGLTERVRTMLQAQPALLGLKTGQGQYGEQPPSTYHIYFWTIGGGRSPIDVAQQFAQHQTLEVMLDFASPVQRLRSACFSGDEAGARVLLRDHPGLIASMTQADHRAIADAAWHGLARTVALMLDVGFDPRTPGHDSGTALHCAAWEGSVDTVKALLRHPDATALVAIKDARYGATPLGWCCHGSRFGNTTHDHAGVARALLEAGARPGHDTREASPAVTAVLAEWGQASS